MTREYVTVVSGMPRSGTSMMMRMLESGGLPLLTDGIRKPDQHNPHGYFEYEPVKRLAADSSWVDSARGKAVKIIYRLLQHLPGHLEYRVIFMDRDLTELFDSQTDMLRARDEVAADQPADRLIAAFQTDLDASKAWLSRQPNIRLLTIPYAGVVSGAAGWVRQIAKLLGGLDETRMAAAVDQDLYRHRHSRI